RAAMARARDDGLDITERQEATERDFRQASPQLSQTRSRYDRDARAGQISFRPHDHHRRMRLRQKRRPERIVALLEKKHKVGGREILLADLDPEPLDSFAR